MNKLKGDLYEVQILEKIRNEGYEAYLWKDIPEKHLLKSGLANSQEDLRLKREKYKKDNNQQNPYIDIGIDILQIDHEQNYIFVQCKNGYNSGLRIEDLAGFSYMMMQYNTVVGHIYYTSQLSSNITNIKQSTRIKFFNVKFKNEDHTPNTPITSNCKIFVPPISEISRFKSNELIFFKTKCKFLMKCLLYNGNQKCIVYCKSNETNKYLNELSKLNNYYVTDFVITNKLNNISNNKFIMISDINTNFNISTDCVFICSENISDNVPNNILNKFIDNKHIYYWCDDYDRINVFDNNLKNNVNIVSVELESNQIKINLEADSRLLQKSKIKLITTDVTKNKLIENKTNDNICMFRKWQKELIEDFLKFIISDDKSGVVISPTGAGKSFMMIYLSLLYIELYELDVMIITQRLDILVGLNDEIKKYHKLFNHSKLLKILPSSIEIIDNTNGVHKKDILINNSNKRKIYIFNNSKFLSSSEFKKYSDLSFGKIGLVCDDECHNSGAEKMHDFLMHVKTSTNIKLMGFSATPSRLHESNKNNSLEIYGDGVQLNVIYERSYVDSLEDGDIVPVLWNIFKISNDDIVDDIENNEEIDETEEITNITKSFKKLNEYGRQKILKYISELTTKSLFKKGIFYFETKSSLLEFYDFYIKNKSKYKSLSKIKIYCTFSSPESKLLKKYKLTKENIDDAVINFKNSDNNSFLFAINRACEGFDDRKSDFGIRLYISNQTSQLLEYQRMGRFARTFEGKTKSTYTTIELIDSTNLTNITNNYIAKYASWVNFVNSLGTSKSKYTKRENENCNKIITIDKLFDIDQMIEIDIVKLKEEIKKQMSITNNTNDFNKIIDKIKKLNVFTINSDFWKEYDLIANKEYLGLPSNHTELYEKFKNNFDNKTWYEILEFDTSEWYQSVSKCKTELQKMHNGTITEKIYNKLAKKNNKLPPHPKIFFVHKDFLNIEDSFNRTELFI